MVRRGRSRGALAIASALTILSIAPMAVAEKPGDGKVCANAYVEGQRLRQDGRLVEARPGLLLCARDPCPKVFQQECADWLADVEKRVPTVVFRARDERGDDLLDVSVSVDGSVIAEGLRGSAAEIDPGEHVLRFDRKGYPPIERRVSIREGEKARLVDVQYDPRRAAEPPPLDPGAPKWPIYAGGAVTVVALVGLASFGGLGVSQWKALQNCKGHCSQADFDATARDLRIADAALGVSIAGAAFTVAYALLRPAGSAPKAPRTAEGPPPFGRVGLVPALGGAGLRVSF